MCSPKYITKFLLTLNFICHFFNCSGSVTGPFTYTTLDNQQIVLLPTLQFWQTISEHLVHPVITSGILLITFIEKTDHLPQLFAVFQHDINTAACINITVFKKKQFFSFHQGTEFSWIPSNVIDFFGSKLFHKHYFLTLTIIKERLELARQQWGFW